MRQLEKPQEALENSLHTFFKCGSNKIFSIAKQVRSADEGMMSAEIATINGGTDYATDIKSKFEQWVYQPSQSHQTI